MPREDLPYAIAIGIGIALVILFLVVWRWRIIKNKRKDAHGVYLAQMQAMQGNGGNLVHNEAAAAPPSYAQVTGK